MFNNLKMGPKILLSLGVMLLITVIVGIFGIREIRTIDAAGTKLYENGAVPLSQMGDIMQLSQRIRVNVRDAIMTGDAANFGKRIDEMQTELTKVEDAFEKSLLSDEAKAAWRTYKDCDKKNIDYVDKMIDMVKTGRAKEAESLLRGEAYQTVQELNKSLDALRDLKVKLAKETSESNTKLANEASTTMTTLIIVGLVLGVVFGWLMQRNVRSIIQGLLTETKRLIDAAVGGKLDTRADPEKINFEFRDIPVGVNQVLDAVIGPLNVAAEYVDRIAKGDIPPKITDKYNGDFNEIKNNLNMAIDAVNALVADAGLLSKAAVEGKLATRADASKHQGDFRKIVQGVNDCLNSVIGPLNVAAEYVDRIAKGDIPPKITDNYNGDFNEIKNNLNMAIDAVNALVADAGLLSKAAVEGKLATRADATRHQGDFRKIVQGVNDCLNSVIGPLNVAAEYVDRISKGDIPPRITDNYNGDFNEIKNNLNATVAMMSDLLSETDKIIKAAADGQLDTRADASKFVGGWNKLVSGVNDTITNIVNPLNVTADYVEKVSKGIIPPVITTEYKGQYNVIKGNLNTMVTMMSDLLSETDKIIKAAEEGKLDTRADATKFVGGWNKLVSGVNDTITNIVNPLNVTADYVEKVSKGVIPPVITTEYKGQYNVIKGNLNTMVEMMSDLLTETDKLVQAAIGGQLATRANASKFAGGWFKLVDGVNKTLNAVIGPLNVAAEYVDRIAKGDIPPKINDTYNGDFNEIKNNLNMAIDAVNTLVTDAGILSKAAVEGKLATRADATKHQGDYRKIVQGVNDCLDAVIGPLNVAAEYVDRIAKGDIPPKINDKYNGDFNEIKNNLNMAIDAVNALVSDAGLLSKAAVDGKLATRADATKHQGDYRKIVQGVDDCLDAVIGPLNVAAEYVDRISKGDIPPRITDKYNGDFNEIKNNLNQAIDAVNTLVVDAGLLSKAAVEGKLATRADATKHQGDYRKIVQGVNDCLDAVIGPLNVAAGYVDRISKGDIPPKITDNYNGDFNTIKNNLNTCVEAVNALVADARMLSQAAVEGKLETRADATKHQGDFAKIVQGVNDTLDAVINPLNEVMRVMAAMEQGDLSITIQQDYKGKLQQLRNAVNNSVKKLADTVGEIGQNANTLASSAEEMTATSANMTTGAEQMTHQSNTAAAATEQATMNVKNMAAGVEQISSNSNSVASASEEVSANLNTVGAAVEQMSSNMKVVADTSDRMTASVNSVATAIEEMSVSLNEVSKSSGQAATIASRAATNAGNAAQIVDKLGLSAQEIGKVVDMIKGIAAQTNLLALNATIEAASAGEAGKGFAVVANEVKELAKQTASATEDIRAQVEGMQGNTSQVVKAIDEIVQIITQINEISGNIAAAVEEQTATTNEISKNVGEAARGANDVARNVKQAAAGANEVSKNVQEAAKGVGDIARNINQLATGANEVARNAGEAAKGMNDVSKNVIQVSSQAKNTTQGAGDTNNAAKELARLAERLQGAVKKFKI